MTNIIPINLAVEDALSEAVARKMLTASGQNYIVGSCYMKYGKSYLQRLIKGLNDAAKGTPFLVLTDLDSEECAPLLIRSWLPIPVHPNLLFRVAVREVEAWVLADATALAEYFSMSPAAIPARVDDIDDPKKCLIGLAARSRVRRLREDIVPKGGSTAKQGPNYNGRLVAFVENCWEPAKAEARSPSLHDALDRLRTFRPTWV